MTGGLLPQRGQGLRKRPPQGHPIQAGHPMPRGTERLVDPRPEAGEVLQGRVQVHRELGSEMGPTPGGQRQQGRKQGGECRIHLGDRQAQGQGRADLRRRPCVVPS